MTLTHLPRRRIVTITLDIHPRIRDELRGLYELGVLELGLSDGDYMHSLYTQVFIHAVDEVLNNLLTYGYPTAKMTPLHSIWRKVGSYENLSDFFGQSMPTSGELCLVLSPIRVLFKRAAPDALAIDHVTLSPAMNYVRVRIET